MAACVIPGVYPIITIEQQGCAVVVLHYQHGHNGHGKCACPINYYLVIIAAGDNTAGPIIINVVGRVFIAGDISRADHGP